MILRKSYMCKEEGRENFHTAIHIQDLGLGGQPQRRPQHSPAHVGTVCHSRQRCEPLPYRGRNYPVSLGRHQPPASWTAEQLLPVLISSLDFSF